MLTGHLWTGLCAVHDSVAAVERERVLQLGQSLLREVIPRVDHPAIRLRVRAGSAVSRRPSAVGRTAASSTAGAGAHLHQDSGAQVLVSVPPVTGAAGAAAGTQDTLVQAVLQHNPVMSRTRSQPNSTANEADAYQFLPVLHRLQVLLLPFVGLVLLLQVGLDRLVLGVEVTHVLPTQTIQSALK